MSNGLAGLDAFDEQSTAMRGEPSVTVGHEDLLVVKTAISTMPGGLHASADVTNVPAEYT